MAMKLVATRRGRPPKFGRPSRTVTLTLPEDLIAALMTADADLSRAVVRLLEPIAHDVVPIPPAELSRYRDSAVIVVRPVNALKAISVVTLVSLADGRALISLDMSMTVADFELKLRDLLDEHKAMDKRERSVLASIVEILKSARESRRVVVRQRSIIVLQSTSRRRIGTM